MPDECGSIVHAYEARPSVSVHHRLFRLEDPGRAELQLQELRARDRLQAERVHPRKFRRRLYSSSRLKAESASEVKAIPEHGAIHG